MTNLVVSTATSYVDWSNVFGGGVIDNLIATVTGLIPEVMPVVVTIIGVSLGIGLMRKLLH
jgi:hypothetical protein